MCTSLQPLLVCSQYISKSVQNSGGGSLLQTSGGCRPVLAAATSSGYRLVVSADERWLRPAATGYLTIGCSLVLAADKW